MNKFVILFTVLCATVFAADTNSDFVCSESPKDPQNWTDMEDSCIKATRRQIQKEVDASYTYMAMAAHFSKDTVNLPGFAKHFFESSGEERSHAIALIEYLTMRGPGKLNQKLVSNLIQIPTVTKTVWTNGLEALKEALATETDVTASIRDVIKTCEGGSNDYHLVDYLTGEFLDEQYKGQRKLAGMIATLSKIRLEKSGYLGEFLFDKTLA